MLIYKKLLIKKRTPDEYPGFRAICRVKTNKNLYGSLYGASVFALIVTLACSVTGPAMVLFK